MRYRVAPAPAVASGDTRTSSLRASVRRATRAAAGAGTPVAACAVVAPGTGDGDPTICLTLDPSVPDATSARGVVARWERCWLLIDSTGHGRRSAARADLEDLISTALVGSTMTGTGLPDADDLGF